MIEPTDMNGSMSVKKFTIPVCGQRRFDSISFLPRHAHCRQNRSKGSLFRLPASQMMSPCYDCITYIADVISELCRVGQRLVALTVAIASNPVRRC